MSKRLELFEQLIAKGSSDPFHHYGRAMELRSLGQARAALEAFDGVIASFPKYVPSYLMGAQLARELGEIERARSIGNAGIAVARSEGNEHALSELSSFVEGLG